MRTVINLTKRLILHFDLLLKTMILDDSFGLFLVNITQRMHPLHWFLRPLLRVVLAKLLNVPVLKRVNVPSLHGEERFWGMLFQPQFLEHCLAHFFRTLELAQHFPALLIEHRTEYLQVPLIIHLGVIIMQNLNLLGLHLHRYFPLNKL